MDWKAILSKEDSSLTGDILHDIAVNLSSASGDPEKNSLMYGDWGKVIFLVNYWKLTGNDVFYDKALEMIEDIYPGILQAIYVHVRSNTVRDMDLSFEKGVSGIGWSINYLIKHSVIEGDINGIMGLTDANIYRQMIEKLHESNTESLNMAVENGKYAVCRDSRLSKEYLRRFITEFYELKDEYYEKYRSENENMQDIARLIRLLLAIEDKYDFEKTGRLADLFYVLLHSKLQAENVRLKYLYAWYILYQSEKYRHDAVSFLENNAESLLFQVKQLSLNAGLQQGLVFTAHLANRFYQVSHLDVCKEISINSFRFLLDKYRCSSGQNKVEAWSTASQMLWGVHQNMYNGLSGIGLSLMAAISDAVPYWDGCVV
ncbi:MAG: hypothetical protein LBK58_00645 [Prevotellaceae bacterium]|jgi:hypothetical protein|nr:hypothetical protein [Prevotellaceae bacterium]